MKVLIIEATADSPSRLMSIFVNPLLYNNSESLYSIDHVLSASCGEQADEVFHKLHPDLVVIDLDHGLDEALRFCQEVRTREKNRHTD